MDSFCENIMPLSLRILKLGQAYAATASCVNNMLTSTSSTVISRFLRVNFIGKKFNSEIKSVVKSRVHDRLPRMNKKLKTVLLWLLLFALPLQGFAASAMLFCETAHHHATPTMQVSSVNEHDHGAHQHELPVSASDHNHHSDSTHHDMTKCSACAACCVGAAIVSSLGNGFSSAQPNSHSIPFSTVHFAGHIPAGLERPPRAILI